MSNFSLVIKDMNEEDIRSMKKALDSELNKRRTEKRNALISAFCELKAHNSIRF